VSTRIRFNQVNLVVGDMDGAIAFYRRLGVDLDASTDDWPPGSGARHVHAPPRAEDADFDLDNRTMAQLWGDRGLDVGDVVLGFELPSGEAVDATYRDLVSAGHTGRRAPYDAFFGARYAIVEDPDGRPVGLMGPVDAQRRFVPELERQAQAGAHRAGEPAATARPGEIQGACLCGAVRFAIDRAVGPFELCHCTRCRKSSGSAYVAGLGVDVADLRFVQGREHVTTFELPVRDRPPAYRRTFCRRCGSPVPDPEPRGRWLEIPAGLLEGDPVLRPDRHIFVEHRAAWTPRGDGLPELDAAALRALRSKGRTR
jgi:uncharacterized glyoxalase superfamily protein PhnB